VTYVHNLSLNTESNYNGILFYSNERKTPKHDDEFETVYLFSM